MTISFTEYNYKCKKLYQCLSPLFKVVSSNPVHGEVYSIQHHVIVIKFQWLAAGRRFSPGTPVSSTNKTDSFDITEILLKVALNTINHKPNQKSWMQNILLNKLKLKGKNNLCIQREITRTKIGTCWKLDFFISYTKIHLKFRIDTKNTNLIQDNPRMIDTLCKQLIKIKFIV